MNRILLFFVFSFLVFFGVNAQNTDNTAKHTYFFTVGDVTSEEQLQEVFSLMEDLKFVTKVKLNFKPEKSDKAQFIIYVTEPVRTSESQVMFQPTDLKAIIIEHNLQLIDLKIDDH